MNDETIQLMQRAVDLQKGIHELLNDMSGRLEPQDAAFLSLSLSHASNAISYTLTTMDAQAKEMRTRLKTET